MFLARVRVAALLATALVPAGIALDVFHAPLDLARLFAVRCAFAAAIFALWALTFVPSLKGWPGAVGTEVALVLAVGIEVMISLTGGAASPYWSGLSVVMVALGLMFPWTGRHMLLVCGAIVLMHAGQIFILSEADTSVALVTNLYFLINVGVVAVFGAYFSMRLRRREFDARAQLQWRTNELKEATGNLRQSVEKLREVDRLKTQLFANVSHELRTPLTVLLAIVEDLQDDPGLAESVSARIEVLRTNARTLLRLINDLLELAASDAGKAEVRRQPVRLDAFVEGAVEELRPFADRRGIQLVAELDPGAVVAADPEKLETVVRNLLSNAVKFTPGGGSVRVRGHTNDGWAVLEVTDTGVGIRAEDQPLIFDRFTRLPAADRSGVRGSGIGLALVREMTRLHGGEVSVESAVGQGSTFRVRLPASAPDEVAAAGATVLCGVERNALADDGLLDFSAMFDGDRTDDPAAQDGAQSAAAPGAATILLVEDHPDLRRFLAQYLGRHFCVLQAADGDAGLEIARERRPDLIVADVMMPKRSGLSLIDALKSEVTLREVPVLLLTAQRGAAVAAAGLTRGADDFVHKPFAPRELLARIKARLRVRELSAQLEHAQRMSMLGTLSAGLAHELRNPINAIVNGLPLVSRAVDPAGEHAKIAQEMLPILEDATNRIRRIVDDLLGFSRSGGERAAPWSADESAERTSRLVGRFANTRIHLELGAVGTIIGFGGKLDQVLTNLFDNALKSAGPTGNVWVRTARREGGVHLTVRDDGPGIPKHVLPRIFDPFFTTRPEGEGTGLGLHVCRQIVAAHNGVLAADSAPGEGATFSLWLPEGA